MLYYAYKLHIKLFIYCVSNNIIILYRCKQLTITIVAPFYAW